MIVPLPAADINVAVAASPTTLMQGGKIAFSGGKNGAWLCYNHKSSTPTAAACAAVGAGVEIKTTAANTNICTAAQPEWETPGQPEWAGGTAPEAAPAPPQPQWAGPVSVPPPPPSFGPWV